MALLSALAGATLFGVVVIVWGRPGQLKVALWMVVLVVLVGMNMWVQVGRAAARRRERNQR